jgi:hypothetical protein
MSLAPDSTLRGLDTCGCCLGLAAATPVRIENRPGLAAVAYRVGTHARFLRSLLAGLSSVDRPALTRLTARTDDFTVALLDAWATVADVLTFSTRSGSPTRPTATARESRSLLELASAIGYAPSPGLAASTYLAFTLEDVTGAPQQVTIAAGTRVQSLPGPGEKPQTFETIADLEARGAWNSIAVRQSVSHPPAAGDTELWLEGTATGLKPGDGLLIVGDERLRNSASERWDFRRLATVDADAEADITRVTWKRGLGEGGVLPASEHPRIYAFRQRAALFGANAPDWRTMPDSIRAQFGAPSRTSGRASLSPRSTRRRVTPSPVRASFTWIRPTRPSRTGAGWCSPAPAMTSCTRCSRRARLRSPTSP